MRWRGNLFVKVFIGFWLATITILASWELTTEYFDSRPGGALDRELKPYGTPHRFTLRTIYKLQTLEDDDVFEVIRQARKEYGVDIYLLDDSNTDLLARDVPEEVARTAEQLQGRGRRAFMKTPRNRIVGHDIYRREQGRLRGIFVFHKPRPGVLTALGGNPWLRVSLAVLISGLICFGLSRLMTNRLKALQLASRRLANGELDTRLQVRDQGGDETDELARDFNTMAEQLQERIQGQKRLLADVSHELRSPLARLRIALALAQDGASGNGNGNGKYMVRIEQEAERLEELIGQLLSSQLPDISLDTHIDLAALLRQLCEDAKFEGQERAVRVTYSGPPGEAIVASAGDLLRKSFDNILRNALAHSPDGSEVQVTLSAAEGEYRVSIEDQGPGVPEAELDTIFNEFYRVDTARARESGGYGLGLAIVRRAIAQHGGQVAAQNTGSGLKITVSLPLHSRPSRC